jgi:hypothetical protein
MTNNPEIRGVLPSCRIEFPADLVVAGEDALELLELEFVTFDKEITASVAIGRALKK